MKGWKTAAVAMGLTLGFGLATRAGENAGAAEAGTNGLRQVSVAEATALKYPEQIVLVTLTGSNGVPNVMTAGWFMFCSGDPEMIAVAIGKTRYTHGLILESKEFVCAFPGDNIREQVLYCGTHSGREGDKFKAAGLTPMKAARVSAPLVAECLACFECTMEHAYDAGDHTIFVGKVVAAWAASDAGQRKRLFNLGRREWRGLP